MTFKEKLNELATIIQQRADKVVIIEEDSKHGGFQQYSVLDYKNAYDAHTDAVNNHGNLVNRITKNNINQNEEYFD